MLFKKNISGLILAKIAMCHSRVMALEKKTKLIFDSFYFLPVMFDMDNLFGVLLQ
jgi:hypothetical protein